MERKNSVVKGRIRPFATVCFARWVSVKTQKWRNQIQVWNDLRPFQMVTQATLVGIDDFCFPDLFGEVVCMRESTDLLLHSRINLGCFSGKMGTGTLRSAETPVRVKTCSTFRECTMTFQILKYTQIALWHGTP